MFPIAVQGSTLFTISIFIHLTASFINNLLRREIVVDLLS